MRGKVAKKLRRLADKETVGKPASETKVVYKQAKKHYKTLTQHEKALAGI